MIIPASYLEDEVRDGFPVPSTIKRAWAVQLIILDKVDAICKKYNIPYYAESGTLLGVVRHGGYIPWDDDLDIVMKRPDYERFLKVAPSELPEGYSLLNINTEEEYDNYLTRIVNNKEINRSESFLNENCGFPYVMGIDLFVMDDLAPTEELLEEQKDYIRKLSSYAKLLKDNENTNPKTSASLLADIKAYMKQAMERYDVTVNDSKSLFNQLYLLQDAILSFYSNNGNPSDIKEIGLTPLWVDHEGSRYPKEYFGIPVMMDFEITKIPVPAYYNAILLKKYGGYMKLVRQGGMHGYPFFTDQIETLESVWGKSVYEYSCTDEVRDIVLAYKNKGTCNKSKDNNSNLLSENGLKRSKYLEEYKLYLDMLCQGYEGFISSFESGQYELALEVLQKCQEVAILLGNSIEKRFGEKHKTIGFLEEYCEAVYGLYNGITNSDDSIINDCFQSMAECTNRIEESIERDIESRRIVAILPFKSVYWEQLDGIYKEEAAREDTDVYVVPVPYYERNMLGNIEDVDNALCDQEGYPEYVKIWDYIQIGIDKLCPDVIIFQNPYDKYNSAVTINPRFYSDRLRQYTDELIYVPYADITDFSNDDGKARRNIKDIVCKPGLIYSDKIILHSDRMREIYVDTLTDFTGDDTREIWEKKIVVNSASILTDSELDAKKTILYYVSGSQLLISREEGLNKIRRTLDTFISSRDKISIRWYHMALDDEILRQNAPDIFKSYNELVEEYKQLGIGSYDEAENVKEATKASTAFYGDPGRIVTSMIIDGKPVMLQNVDV